MTIEQFAEHLLASDDFEKCYIAVMNGEETWMLEVEIPDSIIAGCYDTGIPSSNADSHGHELASELASELALRLDEALTDLGVTVYKTRDEWELADEDDEEDE